MEQKKKAIVNVYDEITIVLEEDLRINYNFVSSDFDIKIWNMAENIVDLITENINYLIYKGLSDNPVKFFEDNIPVKSFFSDDFYEFILEGFKLNFTDKEMREVVYEYGDEELKDIDDFAIVFEASMFDIAGNDPWKTVNMDFKER